MDRFTREAVYYGVPVPGLPAQTHPVLAYLETLEAANTTLQAQVAALQTALDALTVRVEDLE